MIRFTASGKGEYLLHYKDIGQKDSLLIKTKERKEIQYLQAAPQRAGTTDILIIAVTDK